MTSVSRQGYSTCTCRTSNAISVMSSRKDRAVRAIQQTRVLDLRKGSNGFADSVCSNSTTKKCCHCKPLSSRGQELSLHGSGLCQSQRGTLPAGLLDVISVPNCKCNITIAFHKLGIQWTRVPCGPSCYFVHPGQPFSNCDASCRSRHKQMTSINVRNPLNAQSTQVVLMTAMLAVGLCYQLSRCEWGSSESVRYAKLMQTLLATAIASGTKTIRTTTTLAT